MIRQLHPSADQLMIPAQFGVRFYDLLGGESLGAGMLVSLTPPWDAARPVEAQASRAGIYLANPLTPAQAARPLRTWTATVRDPVGRFLACRFPASLPQPALQTLAAWPESLTRGALPLFTAPARPLVAPVAVIRADLREPGGRPAAWAYVEASLEPPGPGGARPIGRGLSDARGCLLLAFPYPPLPRPPVRLSGPGAPSWRVRLAARYAPPAAAADPPGLPDLAAIPSLPAARLLASRPNTALGPQEITYGEELILRTADEEWLIIR